MDELSSQSPLISESNQLNICENTYELGESNIRVIYENAYNAADEEISKSELLAQYAFLAADIESIQTSKMEQRLQDEVNQESLLYMDLLYRGGGLSLTHYKMKFMRAF